LRPAAPPDHPRHRLGSFSPCPSFCRRYSFADTHASPPCTTRASIRCREISSQNRPRPFRWQRHRSAPRPPCTRQTPAESSPLVDASPAVPLLAPQLAQPAHWLACPVRNSKSPFLALR